MAAFTLGRSRNPTLDMAGRGFLARHENHGGGPVPQGVTGPGRPHAHTKPLTSAIMSVAALV
jgi:hypothetical protein